MHRSTRLVLAFLPLMWTGLGLARQVDNTSDRIFDSFDKNKDGTLSREEMPEGFRGRFDEIDADRDGALSREELRMALERHQRAMDKRLREDWADLARYREENAGLGPPAAGEDRVVFLGDSITDNWGRGAGKFFPGKPYVNRGISGQTTPQMLVRFRADVIDLKPKVVVILAGTNDLAGNTGPMTPEMIEGNLMSMAELARANGIRVVLASVLPAKDYPWRPGLEPAGKIAALNAWIKDYAARNGIVYLDYYSAMVDDKGGLKAELSSDGVHPNDAGYALMAPLAEEAIAEALGRRAGSTTSLAPAPQGFDSRRAGIERGDLTRTTK